jgi:hypothetical protein
MASSFKGWGTSWANTWERISNPNAMYGSVTIRVTTTGTLTAANNGFVSGSASLSIGATGTLTFTGTPIDPPALPPVLSGGGGGSVYGKPIKITDDFEDVLLMQAMEEDIIVMSILQTIVRKM